MTDKEAMTKDVLKYLQPNAIIPIDMETTIALVNALKEALAQSEQEPDDIASIIACRNILDAQPVPPRRTWVSLSDEDRNDCLVEADPCECLAEPEAQELMRCVEAKSRSKNQ